MNSLGQVIIPKTIRKFFKSLFNLNENISMRINLMPDGSIQLVPTKEYPVSVFMENDSELLRSAARAYMDSKNENFVPQKEIDALLKD